MWYRVKQFWDAVTAVITNEDIEFLNNYLDAKEIELFNRMDIPTRKHCINVAKEVCKRAKAQHLDSKLYRQAVKGALFHDIGKSNANIGTLDKVVYVLLKKTFPKLFNNVRVNPPKMKLFRKFGFKISSVENHPKFGAILAKKQGLDQKIVNIIYDHHKEDSLCPLVRLVREADELY